MNYIEMTDEQSKEKKECLELLEKNLKTLMTINISEVCNLTDNRATFFRELLSEYAKDMKWNYETCFKAIYKINVFQDICFDVLHYLVWKTISQIVEIKQNMSFKLRSDMDFIIIRQKGFSDVLSRWDD